MLCVLAWRRHGQQNVATIERISDNERLVSYYVHEPPRKMKRTLVRHAELRRLEARGDAEEAKRSVKLLARSDED
jgi:hypothetical protein